MERVQFNKTTVWFLLLVWTLCPLTSRLIFPCPLSGNVVSTASSALERTRLGTVGKCWQSALSHIVPMSMCRTMYLVTIPANTRDTDILYGFIWMMVYLICFGTHGIKICMSPASHHHVSQCALITRHSPEQRQPLSCGGG